MSPLEQVYESLYNALSELREQLHSTGRLDDSNAKLDELVKVLAVCHSAFKGWIDKDSIVKIIEKDSPPQNTVKVVKGLFKKCASLPQFTNNDGSSIFGANPGINIQDSENEFAFTLVKTVYLAFEHAISTNKDGHPFDFINESFGHFVRDNFRNNIEDAQYMTPSEVVNFICSWALLDILRENKKAMDKQFIVMDPSCGVGSFLASFYSQSIKLNDKYRKTITLVGQDKVDRMVRLSKINMMLFDSENHVIECGNSLIGNDFLNSYNDKVDLIITNPPFGAKFDSAVILNEPNENYPLLNDVSGLSNKVDSELLFIDREMSMLKDGGRLFVVLPDSSVSARGISETLRERISRIAEVKGIIELPSVTFAQAGTRTKTVILYLQKRNSPNENKLCLLSNISSLGFEVSMRKGVPVKKYQGKNELAILMSSIEGIDAVSASKGVILESPSCVLENSGSVTRQSWTPSHYSAKRINAEAGVRAKKGYKATALEKLALFETKKRRRLKEESGSKCISVLHIIGDGFINFTDFMTYKPKTRGNVCYAGDILFSKINPRITRVLVVPSFGFPTTCSTEFEIIRPQKDVDPYWLAFVLQEAIVQDQIQSLTSGTSSSHNRIKTAELERVFIPLPITEKTISTEKEITKTYKKAIVSIIDGALSIYRLRHG
jgi:type I restriction-modification system DNA methylase subunit